MAQENLADDLLRGVKAISEYSGLTEREIYHLAPKGKLPLFKMGNRSGCARRHSGRQHKKNLEANQKKKRKAPPPPINNKTPPPQKKKTRPAPQRQPGKKEKNVKAITTATAECKPAFDEQSDREW